MPAELAFRDALVQRGERGQARVDPSLADRHCVYQRLRRHFARYTPETVSRVCGTPPDKLRQLAETVLREAENVQWEHKLSEAGKKEIKYATRALLLPAYTPLE